MLFLPARIRLKSFLALLLLAVLPACAAAQEGSFKDTFGLKGGRGGPRPLPEFKVDLRPSATAGEALLRISVKIPDEHYIYSTNDNGGPETRITIKSSEGIATSDSGDPLPQDAGFVADHPPQEYDDPDLGRRVEKYYGHVEWERTIQLLDDATPAATRVTGIITYQVCDKHTCRLGKVPFDVTLAAGRQPARGDGPREEEDGDGDVAPPAGNSEPPPASRQAPSRPGAVAKAQPKPGEIQGDGPNPDEVAAGPSVSVSGIDKSQGLLWFMLTAAGFGFAALLTPCSFPMVPITVSFFHKQAEKAHHRPVAMAVVYCLGIIGTFTILGILLSVIFGPAFLNQLSNNPWLNLFLALLLVFFAFNLLGMFEIRIPSWLLTYTATQEGRGGLIGVLFMSLTFTLTSFTCTFAFVGGLLVQAAQGDRLWPAVGLFVFSAAFSLPFFFLALFPSFLQRLPRSGGWMNAVKVIMGLVELGAAFKFFSVADLRLHPVAWVFDYELVMSAWMIISIAAGMYLLGMYRLPHDMAMDHIGIPRFILAMSFFGLAAYLGVGLYSSEKPSGKVWENIAAFAPPKFKGANEQFGPALEHGGIKYALDFQKAVEYAARQNKPLFLDFTGVNCTNCRKMEKGPLSQPQVTERLKNFVCVQVYADKVPHIADNAEAERLLEFNIELQTQWFGDTTLPSYAVIPPDPEIARRKNGENLLSVTIGYNPDEAQFSQFLDQGLNRWKQFQASGGKARVVGQR